MTTKNFKQIGPIKLPHEWKKGQVESLTHRQFRFDTQSYLIAEVGKIKDNSLVRIQSACALADIFESKWCDCAWQLKATKEILFNEGSGLLIFAFDQHGKGVGLENHYKLYAEGQKRNQEILTETFDFLGLNYENRNYEDIAEILKFYNLKKIRLMTNDPFRIKSFENMGFEVERFPLETPTDHYNKEELLIKKNKFGHLINVNQG